MNIDQIIAQIQAFASSTHVQEIGPYVVLAFVVGWFIGTAVARRSQARALASFDSEQREKLKDIQERHEDELQKLRERIEELESIPSSGAGENWENEYPLEVISDIETSTIKKFSELGITSTKALYKACDNEQAILELAEKVRVEDFAIQRWVSIAQLLRVANIEVVAAELLEATEVYSISDLANQKPERLLEKLSKTNERENLISELPSEKDTNAWIQHAQHLLTLTE